MRKRENLEYYELAQKYYNVAGITGALKGICEKVVSAGTAEGLSDKELEILDKAEMGNVANELADQEDRWSYIKYQVEKDN